MNTFVNYMDNTKLTENGATAHKSTTDAVYDLFAFGGAYRQRSEDDCVVLFKNAYMQSPELALKCLFYLYDVRGGQGERRFFNTCFSWLIGYDMDAARKLLQYIPYYGRWDMIINVTYGTPLFKDAMVIVDDQLFRDAISENECSLCAKWMPSENASSVDTKKKAAAVRHALGMSARNYRQFISKLRAKCDVLERKMSANEWDTIKFDKIPSKAGMKYRKAFMTREETKDRYNKFMQSDKTQVNAGTLYPYEIVSKARHCSNLNEETVLNKYWKNLPDYFNGAENSMMCVCDTSGSMTWGTGNVAPIDVAISLSIYASEHNKGEFADRFITFSETPQFVNIEGGSIVDKTMSVYNHSIIASTNLEAVFELLLNGCVQGKWAPEDLPKTLVVISDMEINQGVVGISWRDNNTAIVPLMEKIRQRWVDKGLYEFYPSLVYWNVNARNNTILDFGEDVSYVSGCSPVLFEQVISGKKGIDLMLEKLLSERYEKISLN